VARYLVVANQTQAAAQPLETILAEAAGRGDSFYVVEPATPPRSGLTWTEGQARALAVERLQEAFARFRAVGLEVDGEVGDPDPMLAVEDVLRREAFDVVVLPTPTSGTSRRRVA
jgi:hypothetical protein